MGIDHSPEHEIVSPIHGDKDKTLGRRMIAERWHRVTVCDGGDLACAR
jgi:hypothetical protein